MRSSPLLLRVFVFLASTLPGFGAASAVPVVNVTRQADRVRVEIAGQLFTEYLFRAAARPFLYPLVFADGTRLTRDFPLQDTSGEDRDHPHQRSLWFAHGLVNGVDFWNEGTAGGPTPKGAIVHETLLATEGGAVGTIRARNRWLAPDGALVCTDETTLRFGTDSSGARWIDYDITIQAPPEKPLLLGDNKEGCMAVRVAQWMTPPHRMNRADIAGTGRIVMSTGVRDAAAWGTRAAWCDYFGAHDGKVYGIALFEHPTNFRHPTWWMARDYGLLAANPFGRHDFEKLEDQHAGDHTVPAGGSLTLRYRFYFHAGDTDTADVAGHYRDYVDGR
jgi:Methane oxygenase PmoA